MPHLARPLDGALRGAIIGIATVGIITIKVTKIPLGATSNPAIIFMAIWFMLTLSAIVLAVIENKIDSRRAIIKNIAASIAIATCVLVACFSLLLVLSFSVEEAIRCPLIMAFPISQWVLVWVLFNGLSEESGA